MLIYLVDPIHTFPGAYYHKWFIPLSALNISAYIQDRFGSEIEVRVFKFPEKIIDAIKNKPPDMIGVSNYIWNYNLGRAILSVGKKVNPSVVTVMGGPNATLTEPKMTDLLADGLIDYYVHDNDAGGEISFSSLVAAKLNGTWPLHKHEEASALWYLDKHTGHARHIPTRPDYEKTMDWLPSPFLKGLADEFFEDGLGAMIETNRGCPFYCTFCVWGAQDNNSRIAQFNVETVKANLNYIAERVNHDLLMINDANFGLFYDRDLEIARHIKKLNQLSKWPVSIVVNWGQVRSDKSIAVADELKGITMLRQSSQSQDNSVLDAIKRDNVPDSQWRHVAEECQQDGIESFAEVIIMLPGETLESYLDGLRFFFSLGIDCITTNQCQLLEGSEMNTEKDREKYGLKTAWRLLEDAYGRYDDYVCLEAEEIVVETSTFPFEDNIRCRKLNWLIQMSWTLRRHNLILRLLQEQDISPVDFLLYVISQVDRAPNEVCELFKDFDTDARNELFPTYENLVEHYSCDERFEGLRMGEFKKLMTYYSGKALVINRQITEFYRQMASEVFSKQGRDSKHFEEMLEECALFTDKRSLSVRTITENLDRNTARTKSLSLMYDIPAWENDPNRSPLSNFRVEGTLRYIFYISQDQIEAICDFIESLPRTDVEYQLQKICEPFYGIRKEHLNYSYRKMVPSNASMSLSQ
ncbi:MAG: hypothetical protein HOI70_05820 [Opitutae bacterium]|jgi:radical SAM superfamily enzyme YgiQ (UPF0313 family)|nr:hypothetical protein [Opitutae bacterium]